VCSGKFDLKLEQVQFVLALIDLIGELDARSREPCHAQGADGHRGRNGDESHVNGGHLAPLGWRE